LQSIRNSAAQPVSSAPDGCSIDGFLNKAEGHLIFTSAKPLGDNRAFELINKTNQFNLNGRRYDESAWSKFLSDPEAYGLTVSYEDKFGKLGRIAVLIGRPADKKFFVDSWVLSCRAFSRRIECHMLQYVYKKFAVDEIVFDVQETARNGPLMEFLRTFGAQSVHANFVLPKSYFYDRAPELPGYSIEEVVSGG
jgi:FkbH-like protein